MKFIVSCLTRAISLAFESILLSTSLVFSEFSLWLKSNFFSTSSILFLVDSLYISNASLKNKTSFLFSSSSKLTLSNNPLDCVSNWSSKFNFSSTNLFSKAFYVSPTNLYNSFLVSSYPFSNPFNLFSLSFLYPSIFTKWFLNYSANLVNIVLVFSCFLPNTSTIFFTSSSTYLLTCSDLWDPSNLISFNSSDTFLYYSSN